MCAHNVSKNGIMNFYLLEIENVTYMYILLLTINISNDVHRVILPSSRFCRDKIKNFDIAFRCRFDVTIPPSIVRDLKIN